MMAHLQRSAGGVPLSLRSGQATCSEGGLDIASNSDLKGDRVTDLCGTARLGGQVCPRKVWLHVQKVSCDNGRLDPAQDRDLSERKRLCSHCPGTNYYKSAPTHSARSSVQFSSFFKWRIDKMQDVTVNVSS